jgi:hypothetical protein
MQKLIQKRAWLTILLAGLLGMLLIGPAAAAETAGGEIYRLGADQVIEDDLYVGASEVYIDGVIEGDLIAAGAYIEINGVVTGDAIVAGAGIELNGQVQDDMRAAGAGVDISGTVGDDLVAASGGSSFAMPIQLNGRTVEQGLHLADSAQVGGDALIAGGEGDIAGTINGYLQAAMGEIVFTGQVGQEARLYSNSIEVGETAQVAETLSYSSDQRLAIPEGVAANVEYIPPPQEAQPDPANIFVSWLIRTLLILIGFALVGWLLLRFAPTLLVRPANAIATQPAQAGLYGLAAAVVFILIPLATILLVLLVILFWGWLPGIMMGLFLLGTLALIWFLSPLVTGLWLGRQLNLTFGHAPDYLPLLLGGILLLALLGRIPILGWFVYLISFLFALGGLVLARRSGGGGALSPVVESRSQTSQAVPARPREA